MVVWDPRHGRQRGDIMAGQTVSTPGETHSARTDHDHDTVMAVVGKIEADDGAYTNMMGADEETIDPVFPGEPFDFLVGLGIATRSEDGEDHPLTEFGRAVLRVLLMHRAAPDTRA